MTNQINAQTVTDLLNSSNWDYEYCGETPSASTMTEYINEIEGNVTVSMVEMELKYEASDIVSAFENESDDSDINEFAANYIADSIGIQISKCIYEGVTFKAYV